MNLYHYSGNSDLVIDKKTFYGTTKGRGENTFKPVGFWVTPDDSDDDMTWPMWCKAEHFSIGGLKYRYKIDVDTNKVLTLNSVAEMQEFENKYAVKGERNTHYWGFGRWIQWNKVEKDYNGILIVPYQWKMRPVSWYNPWDCASGCIWKLKNILNVEKDTSYSFSPREWNIENNMECDNDIEDETV